MSVDRENVLVTLREDEELPANPSQGFQVALRPKASGEFDELLAACGSGPRRVS